MSGDGRDLEAHMDMAFELFDFGDQVMMQNLRRRHPDESEEEIRERFQTWLLTRPGAEHGDAGGSTFRPREIEL